MKKKILTGSIIAVAILIGVSFTSVVGYNSVESTQKDNKDYTESRELLFETIIKIANNPEFRELIKNNEQNLFPTNFEYTDIYSQLSKQKLIYSICKPTLSKDYLQVIYEYGCEIINILGKEKASELIASIELTNNGIFQELNNIIENDEELTNSITNLKRMNLEIYSTTDFRDSPLICGVLLIIMIAMMIIQYSIYIPIEIIFFQILKIPKNEPFGIFIIGFFMTLTFPLSVIFTVSLSLFIFEFMCYPDPYPEV